MALLLESGISVYRVAVNMATAVQVSEVAENIRMRLSDSSLLPNGSIT